MSLSSALSIATSSLNLAQEGITTSANNLANINTPGYIRQQQLQQSVVVDGHGQGAQTIGISANVDLQLLKSIQSQTSSLGGSATLDAYYNNIQNLYGQPNASNSLSSEINAFFSAYQNLSNNPETPSLRAAALNASIDLATKISSTANSLEDMRYKADSDIGTAVKAINGYLQNIAGYNEQIINFQENSAGYINIKQQMTQALNNLSQYMNISTTTDTKGKVSVTVGNGIALIDDSTNARLRYDQAASADVFKNDTTLSALKVIQTNADGSEGYSTDLATGGKSGTIITSLADGSLKSLLDMRDRTIPSLVSQLDTLAGALINEVNAIQNNGFGFPPPASLKGTTLITNNAEIDFTGSVRIAVINSDGSPATSPYPDETHMKPLTIDLSSLNAGEGPGRATVQTIIDQINDYYGPVQNRATVGNLRNIQLEATSNTINNTGVAQFDLKLDNSSTLNSTVTIQNVTVIDPNTSIEYNIATLPNPNSYTLAAGDMHSTGQPFSIDLTAGGIPNIANYIVRVSTQVTDGAGNVSRADVDFNVANNVTGNINKQYNASAVTGTGGVSEFIVAPSATTYAHAELVDKNGLPVAAGEEGTLRITTIDGRSYGIVIDEMDSKEVGVPGASSSSVTNRGFSQYFGLNNLFVDNGSTKGAAINMSLRTDIKTNANLISTGRLTLSKQPTDPNSALYTYEAGSGNNGAALEMAALSNKNVYFVASGSLPSVNITFSGYSADIIGAVASDSLNATNQSASQQLGMDGLQTLFQKAAGVNSDEELSKIIDLQNHFSASAQVINIVQKLFDILSQSLR